MPLSTVSSPHQEFMFFSKQPMKAVEEELKNTIHIKFYHILISKTK